MSPLRSLVAISYLITHITSLALPRPQATSSPTDTIYAYPNNNGQDQAANALTQQQKDPNRYKPDAITCFPNSSTVSPIRVTYCQDLLTKWVPTVMKTSDAGVWDPKQSANYQWGDGYLGGDMKRCVLSLFPLNSHNSTAATFTPDVFLEGAGFVVTRCPFGGTATLKTGTGGDKWAYNVTNALAPGAKPNPPDPTGTPIPFKTGGGSWSPT